MYNVAMNAIRSKNGGGERRIADKRFRISVDSIREIRRGIQKEVDRLRDDLEWDWEGGVEGAPRSLRPAHLANALFAWFLGLPEEARSIVARDGLELYIARLDGDPNAPFQPSPLREIKTRGVGGYVIEETGHATQAKGEDLTPSK